MQQYLVSPRHYMLKSGKGTPMSAIATLDQHETISRLAYQLWEQEGRPDDRAEFHWFQAETIVNSKSAVKKSVKGQSTGAKARKA
jgi:Protein of unknown function (DUF2934)